ncbi:N-acylglucosamine-6-phosphate 2-epimerase [Sanguibacter gelidistatuariae]|uniref:Putative N-acetylmannosamine-6-phosphate 2-epimerase n=1 Tax=Sanguibacter gelidistatuariae TaxID=1814289 RepID=A0A1G6HDF0_9MICO|nr:N-acetylmannosamine-6-phosphate 2-epimerase [Sanguibacter gelidistatuariae]SDB92290.1 N-acylglucosamine-6-phosphate 2-epimerase [Sanguibacter gelidistatuariae]
MSDDALDAVRGQLIVSCQAAEGEPLRGPVHMSAMALTVLAGGASGLRLEGPDDVAAVRALTTAPIIGLWKITGAPVYITPTLAAVRAVAEAGADIVAVDGTGRERPDGSTFADVVDVVHREYGRLVMADVATLEEGVAAAAAGADVISTTLSGYTGGPVPAGPDLDLVSQLAAALEVPVVAEGRIGSPEEVAEALRRGAWAVVVGGAITRPAQITASFVAGTR